MAEELTNNINDNNNNDDQQYDVPNAAAGRVRI